MTMPPQPKRLQLRRTKGWRLPPGAVKVDRSTRWGNPFDFRRSEYCWTALSFGCRGDAAGRQEASVRAFRDWIDPPHGRQMLSMEEQPKMAGPGGEVALGPPVKAGAAPSREEIREILGGKNLACWCKLCPEHAAGKPLGITCEACGPCHVDVYLEVANS